MGPCDYMDRKKGEITHEVDYVILEPEHKDPSCARQKVALDAYYTVIKAHLSA